MQPQDSTPRHPHPTPTPPPPPLPEEPAHRPPKSPKGRVRDHYHQASRREEAETRRHQGVAEEVSIFHTRFSSHSSAGVLRSFWHVQDRISKRDASVGRAVRRDGFFLSRGLAFSVCLGRRSCVCVYTPAYCYGYEGFICQMRYAFL